jgi:membrane protein implicated in regulation of membrane protease activity
MVYWGWLLLGLGLLVLEVATPGGFFALFFGLSALVVGGLVGLGWAGPAWMQWLLFSGLAVVALAVLRKPLQARLSLGGSGRAVDSLAAETAFAVEDIAVGAIGKAELRGTTWSAKNGGAEVIVKGQRLKVDRVEGLTLHVHKE